MLNRFWIPVLTVTPLIVGAASPASAQFSGSVTIGGPSSFGYHPNPYSRTVMIQRSQTGNDAFGSFPAPLNGETSTSQTIIIQLGQPYRSIDRLIDRQPRVIIAPGTVIINGNNRGFNRGFYRNRGGYQPFNRVRINPAPNCGTVIYGSPIVSPIPVDPYSGQACR